MVLKTLVLSLALVLPCFSQSGTQAPPFFWGRRPIDPNGALPSGMRFRYKASDLTNTPVSDWIDEISSYHWTASGAARPAWDTNGVTFNGSSSVMDTTNGFMINNGDAFLMVFIFSNTAPSSIILGRTFSGGDFTIGVSPSDVLLGPSGVGVSPIGTKTMDFLTVQTGSGPTRYDAFTNGITGWNAVGAWGGVNNTRFGSGAGNGFTTITLKELIYWTNVGIWNPTIVSNVHWYTTNVYPHTP